MHVNIQVYNIIKRKMSNEKGAEIMNLPVHEYKRIKHVVLKKLKKFEKNIHAYLEADFDIKNLLTTEGSPDQKVVEVHNNIDEGTSRISGISMTEPRSVEEIIALLKIDTTRWKLSQYWNKEKNGYWQISALISRLPLQEREENSFLETLEQHKVPKFKPRVTPLFIDSSKEKISAVMSLQDLHFGKPGNDDMEKLLLGCVENLLSKAANNFQIEELIFVVGGDLLNMDTFLGTTTKGTPVDNAAPAQDVYISAFDAMHKALQLSKQYVSNVKVLFIPGNHDRLSSYHLVHALSRSFQGIPGFDFDHSYSERKVHLYGDNMFCFEHGDIAKKDTPLVYATEFPQQWGQATHRTLYTGHYHKKKTTEYVTENEEHGFSIKILPSLSHTDYWHYHNKFTGNKRAGVLELHDHRKGKIVEFHHII